MTIWFDRGTVCNATRTGGAAVIERSRRGGQNRRRGSPPGPERAGAALPNPYDGMWSVAINTQSAPAIRNTGSA